MHNSTVQIVQHGFRFQTNKNDWEGQKLYEPAVRVPHTPFHCESIPNLDFKNVFNGFSARLLPKLKFHRILFIKVREKHDSPMLGFPAVGAGLFYPLSLLVLFLLFDARRGRENRYFHNFCLQPVWTLFLRYSIRFVYLCILMSNIAS